MSQSHVFATLSPTRLFFRCALPNMISMAVMSFYVVVDGIFVGRYIGQDALAAVNLVMPFIMVSFALSDMVAVGSSVQIAIRLGEKKPQEASRIFSFSSLLIEVIACVAGLLALLFARPLVQLMGADEVLTNLAVEYMQVYALWAPAVMIFFAVDNYLRICGKATYSMVINVVMSLGNVFLDWLFIAHFGWGVASAALASCISLAVGTLLGFLPFLAKRLPLRFCRGWLPWRLVGNMLANGSSEFFSNIAGSVCMVFLNSALLRLSGAQAVAAFSIVMYIDTLVSSMLFGMADSMQGAISYNHGAGEHKRALALEKRVLLFSGLLSLSALFLMRQGGGAIIPLFLEGDSPALLAMTTRAMELFSLSYLVGWFVTSVSAFFTAVNKPIQSLAVAFSQTLLFPLFFLFLLPALLGLDGVWLVTPAAKLAGALLAGGLLLQLLWRRPQEEKESLA